MIARIQSGSYMEARGAHLAGRDDFGELWRLERYYPETGEPLVMVKVVNATPNPDGSFKDYWLQVPPDMTSARAAVAWSFDVPEPDYAPAVQT